MAKLRVGVVFGSRSGEHEVSVISAHQVMAALEVAGYTILPIYIAKDGRWFAGQGLNNLKAYKSSSFDPRSLPGVFQVSLSPDPTARELVLHPMEKRGFFSSVPKFWADLFFPVMHGSFGEDGTLQGLFELANVPYTGPGVMAAGITMDKVRTKALCRDAGIPILDFRTFTRETWRVQKSECLTDAESVHGYPLIVKPVSLGSSIGVKRCANREELVSGIETALVLDEQVLIEPALVDFAEFNCSVFGPPEEASVCEQPVAKEKLLSFEDKYKRGGSGAKGSAKGAGTGSKQRGSSGMASLDRIIPAPISTELTTQVQDLAKRAFRAVCCSGIARIDFLYDRTVEKLYFNEINPIPGSLAFYLWEASGVPFDKLVTKAVDLALLRAKSKAETMYSFESNLLGQ